MQRHRRLAGELALVGAGLAYGTTFLVVQRAVDDISPALYVVARFALASVLLAPFARRALRRSPARARALWVAGWWTGVCTAAGYLLQTIGLQYTTTSTSAFVTGLYVVFTPLVVAIGLRRRPARTTLVAVGVAALGLFLLTGARPSVGRGELLTLACALAFAVWIVVQGHYAAAFPPVALAAVQLAVVALVLAPVAAVGGAGHMTWRAGGAIVYTAVVASALAFSLQVFGQRRIPPTRSALILLLEPVSAGVIGAVAGEHLGAVGGLGAALIVVAILLAESSALRSRARSRVLDRPVEPT